MKSWTCSVCGYVHEGDNPPENCPVCGTPQSAFKLRITLSPTLEKSIKEAFAGESKAYIRNQAFARKADEEGYIGVANLFRAVAQAERIHASNYLKYLEGVVGDTEENLQTAFENENMAKLEYYPKFVKQAFDEDREEVALSFSRARDVEERHADLYKEALSALATETDITYHVCQVCGYVFTGDLPDQCPVCQAGKDQFIKVE